MPSLTLLQTPRGWRPRSGALIISLVLALLAAAIHDLSTRTETSELIQPPRVVLVKPDQFEVIDGDTVRLAGDTIRLVGFDTPETYKAQCETERRWGDAATIRLTALLDTADRARLAILPQPDDYGRTLAQLWLDDRDIADIMVGEGLGRRYLGGQRGSWC